MFDTGGACVCLDLVLSLKRGAFEKEFCSREFDCVYYRHLQSIITASSKLLVLCLLQAQGTETKNGRAPGKGCCAVAEGNWGTEVTWSKSMSLFESFLFEVCIGLGNIM